MALWLYQKVPLCNEQCVTVCGPLWYAVLTSLATRSPTYKTEIDCSVELQRGPKPPWPAALSHCCTQAVAEHRPTQPPSHLVGVYLLSMADRPSPLSSSFVTACAGAVGLGTGLGCGEGTGEEGTGNGTGEGTGEGFGEGAGDGTTAGELTGCVCVPASTFLLVEAGARVADCSVQRHAAFCTQHCASRPAALRCHHCRNWHACARARGTLAATDKVGI